MRDLLIVLMVFGSVPVILMRPWVGVIVWCWLGFMNPHRLTWGFAYDFPFAMLVAVVTFVAVLTSSEKKQFAFNYLTLVWITMVLWFNVTTMFALNHETVWLDFDRTMKIQLFSFLTVALINTKEKIQILIWVTVLSLGFFGIKGGIFSVLTGGGNLVWGPPGSFINGNNSLGLALVMTLPLMYYLFSRSARRELRWGLLVAMGLTALAVLTTHSRGAFLALGSMLGFLWLKSDKKWFLGVLLLLALPILIGFMPEEWVQRMWSIRDYQEDGSALGRINAWWFAYNLALDHPFTGGGFGTFTQQLFLRYAPNPTDFHDAHSIYFEVLAEHGFVGLVLFLLLGLFVLIRAGSVSRKCKNVESLGWAGELMRVVQVSLVGYAVGGLFLGLAYFDLYYHLVAMVVITGILVEKELKAIADGTNVDADADADVSELDAARKRRTLSSGKPRPGDRFASGSRGS